MDDRRPSVTSQGPTDLAPELTPYLQAGEFIDCDDADVKAFARATAAGAGDPVARAVSLSSGLTGLDRKRAVVRC